MSSIKELGFTELAPLSGGAPKKVVIFLHGLGSNGDDLINIGAEWQQILPEVHFLSPNAPEPCDFAPVGHQWFSLEDRSSYQMISGAQKANPVLNNFIDQQLDRLNLTDADLAIVGFSQGTMMALYTAPRRKNPCAGIIAYSGAIIAGKELYDGTVSTPAISPILAIHGDSDDVVPIDELTNVHYELEKSGFTVEALTCPGIGHWIDKLGLIRGGNFLREAFAGNCPINT